MSRLSCHRPQAFVVVLVLSLVTAVSGAQRQEHLALMTKGKLEADLGNYTTAAEAFATLARDDSVPAALRWEALVRLGLARSGAGDTRGSLEALRTVLTRYSTDRSAVRFAIGAIATAVPGKIWPEFRTELEELLRTAEITSVMQMGRAEVGPKLARLKWDDFELRAVWKTDVQRRPDKVSRSHAAELAAYEIDKMLGLDMVPPAVARTVEGQAGSLTFWVNGCRVYQDVREMPKTSSWKHQTSRMSLYDNLIGNPGRHSSNMLVDPENNLILLDYEFGFSDDRTLKEPPLQFDRRLVEKLRALDEPESRRRMSRVLGDDEIEGVLARRDALLLHLKTLIAERGEAAVLF